MEISGPTPQWINPPAFDEMLREYMDQMAADMERSLLSGLWRGSRPTSDRFYQRTQWDLIGAGILPWIPRSQAYARDLRHRARLALGEFLIDHGIIEVPEDDNDYW